MEITLYCKTYQDHHLINKNLPRIVNAIRQSHRFLVLIKALDDLLKPSRPGIL